MPFLKIENLTNSPFDLEGGIILPAFGKVEADFTPEYAALLDHSLALKVETFATGGYVKAPDKPYIVGEKSPEPFPYKIGSQLADDMKGDKTVKVTVSASDDIESLREEAASLDIKVDGRWSAHRLQQEIDKALK